MHGWRVKVRVAETNPRVSAILEPKDTWLTGEGSVVRAEMNAVSLCRFRSLSLPHTLAHYLPTSPHPPPPLEQLKMQNAWCIDSAESRDLPYNSYLVMKQIALETFVSCHCHWTLYHQYI